MNLIIIIMAAVAAYVLAELFTIIDGSIAEWQLKQEGKKRLNNELYRFKLRQLYLYCKSYYTACGYSGQKAEILAINAVRDMDEKFLIDEKYKMIRKKANGNDSKRYKKGC